VNQRFIISSRPLVLTIFISRAHKEILVFASPFFDAALSGRYVAVQRSGHDLEHDSSWSETNARPVSMSSIITIQQPPSVHGELATAYEEQEDPVTITPVAEEAPLIPAVEGLESSEGEGDFCAVRVPSIGNDSEPEVLPRYSSSSSREGGDEDEGEEEAKTPSAEDLIVVEAERNAARISSLEKLQGKDVPSISYPPSSSKGPGSKSPKKKGRRRSRIPDGIIILKEERATIFHDFLKFVYPQCVYSRFTNCMGRT